MHQVYDDETTFKLVAAASNVSGLPVEVCLEEFGKHFLVYCQKNGYDQILRVLGSNLYDFLTNLDNLHDHLASIYPGMRAPSFRVSKQLDEASAAANDRAQSQNNDDEQQRQQQQQGAMYLHYYSERKGLSPIVKGLVMAVAKEFFSTDIIVTECAQTIDDHVVLKIDRRSQAQIGLDKQTNKALQLASHEAQAEARETHEAAAQAAAQAAAAARAASERSLEAEHESRQAKHKAAMLSAAYGDLLSNSARDSLINSEIMMQAFPFHVIFDGQFRVVQVGKSLLRATSLFWRRRKAIDEQNNDKTKQKSEPAKFSDLFAIVRPKIEPTFNAIADHTNQVFVVRTKRHVLNADLRRAASGEQSCSKQHHSVATPSGARCPFDRVAQARRLNTTTNLKAKTLLPPERQDQVLGEEQNDQTREEFEQVHDTGGDPAVLTHISLRLKGQMIMLSGLEQERKHEKDQQQQQQQAYCMFLCSPRVDHLDQLYECGISMGDFAVHDRARELMLMSHTHKEDREAVKKLDQASNDLKKMDTKLRQENKRTNEVLHNIFPAKIAALLSHGHKVESESHELVSCLYSDIIGFTKMCGSENVRPIDIVRLLNTLYLQFDNLTNIHGVYKVETIGDAYVVVGGLPEPVEDHADRCVRMGLDMVKVIATVRSPADSQPIQMRIGIHSGPVMAGIVGIRVPRYSLFGNTTTLANQLETHGVGGKIHISDFTLENLIERERFVIEPNQNQINSIPFKTYFVTNFIGDEIETLNHERILEEQLLRDFVLMGNEVELVDDSNRSSSAISSATLATASTTNQTLNSNQELAQPEPIARRAGRQQQQQQQQQQTNLIRDTTQQKQPRDSQAVKRQTRVYKDVEGATMEVTKSAETAKTNNHQKRPHANDGLLLARELSSKIIAEALDQCATDGVGQHWRSSSLAQQTAPVLHSNEAQEEALLERLLALLASNQSDLHVRLRSPGACGDGSSERADTCPLCDGFGSLRVSQLGGGDEPLLASDQLARLLAAAAVASIATSVGPAACSRKLNRLLERLPFSLSFCPQACEPQTRPASQHHTSKLADAHNWPEMSGRPSSGAGGPWAWPAADNHRHGGEQCNINNNNNNNNGLERLLEALRAELRKLEQQVERLGQLAGGAPVAANGRNSQQRCSYAASPGSRSPRVAAAAAAAGGGRAPSEPVGVCEEVEDDDDEPEEFARSLEAHEEEHEFGAASPLLRQDQQHRQPRGSARCAAQPARILNTNIQRMKRMDTLKRRKLTRTEVTAHEQQQQQQQRKSGCQLVESGSIRSVHSSGAPAVPLRPTVQSNSAMAPSDSGADGSERKATAAAATATESADGRPPAARHEQQQQQRQKAAYIYHSVKNSLANLMSGGSGGDSPSSTFAARQAAGQLQQQQQRNPSTSAVSEPPPPLEANDGQQAGNKSQSLAPGAQANVKRFSLSAFGSSFSAALVSSFGSPKKEPLGASGANSSAAAAALLVDSDAEQDSMTALRPQQQLGAGHKPGTARAIGSNAKSVGNCSCLRSSGSSQSLDSDAK